MARRVVTVLLAASFALAGVGARIVSTSAPEASAAAKPNIVVVYVDDTAAHDGRLWSNPVLTPTLHNLFVAHGIEFTNAIAETPLCCPARGTFLTGLHTHNTGVKTNDARLLNPAETIGTALRGSGYTTMWMGKYLNHAERLSKEQWTAHAAGWDYFDVFSTDSNATDGYFYNYGMYTKQEGTLFPSEHSTKVIAERTVARLRTADPAKPVFAVMSIYNTHAPHIPMPGFESDPRYGQCDKMAPWNPPNYNEADVSDKPGYVRNRPLYPYKNGWPITQHCKEMLGVDWAARQVVSELRAQGRFDNTMFVFTADNGMDWGSHRLDLKQTPYSTPVPLYFSWPARWGNAPREEDEYTSNIDLAPTFCAVGGCSLGPFPGGQRRPDGVSLLPILDDPSRTLSRDALLETSWDTRVWAAVRTTDKSDLGLWHYVENAGGFRELYNLDPDEDPYELENLAYQPQYADLQDALADRLVELLAEGRPQDGTASIKIVEDEVPNGATDFQFSGDLGTFALDDDSDPTLPRARTFSGLTPGSYTIRQTQITGWSLISLVCGTGSTVNLSTATATVHALAGETAVCTFKNTRRRPDASIALEQAGPYKTNDYYAPGPGKKQTQRRDLVEPGQAYDFWVHLQNDSAIADSFSIRAQALAVPSMVVNYNAGGGDVTPQVVAGTYRTAVLAPGQTVTMIIRVTVAPDAPAGIVQKVVVTQKSDGDPVRVDVVRAIVTR